MNTYYETYLPIAVIILESTHIGRKTPPRKDKNFIIRKKRSGEPQHSSDRSTYKGQFVRDEELTGQLPSLAKKYPAGKRLFVKSGHETSKYHFGKGSKAKRRMEKLKNR